MADPVADDDRKLLVKEFLDLDELKAREAKSRAVVLEILGDIPDADVAPPKNVLFVCKLNQVTEQDDLKLIFSRLESHIPTLYVRRFGPVRSCDVIRDYKTGDSLQYAFVEFESEEACNDAYFKMQNVLIDDRRIHVDFCQSVSGFWKRFKENGTFTRTTKGNLSPSEATRQRQPHRYGDSYRRPRVPARDTYRQEYRNRSTARQPRSRSGSVAYRSRNDISSRRYRSRDRYTYRSQGRDRPVSRRHHSYSSTSSSTSRGFSGHRSSGRYRFGSRYIPDDSSEGSYRHRYSQSYRERPQRSSRRRYRRSDSSRSNSSRRHSTRRSHYRGRD
ncbi:RNA recognition motif domain containing protein [Babesia ovata]|uniref:Peptidyl-prolyl cis-trans isomerase n=1 Tax=Babesia ovata TaxID=189622 RepID=A0A2H6K8K3_9APIC|nr:RNA recognition motif domain containing protein [Babesia ovata]GBE59327.1 RNA recognition motif domain containing protein [Babesia ovata]